MPDDPSQLMALTTNLNDLTGNEMKPWHLKADLIGYDPNGSKETHGTYEQFWGSPNQYRVTVTDSHSSQTVYGTAKGEFLEGKLTGPLGALSAFEDTISQPLAGAPTDDIPLELRTEKIGETELRCIYTTPSPETVAYQTNGSSVWALPASQSATHNDKNETMQSKYCVNSALPVLRIVRTPLVTVIRNNISVFHGHFVAGETNALRFGSTRWFSVHIAVLEDLNAVNDADFAPPPDATLYKSGPKISGAMVTQQILKTVPPIYPPIARAAGVSGTVTLEVEVDKMGCVNSVQVFSGPPMLRQATVDAVGRWIFKPYLSNGEPMEFRSVINVVFR
jgi:TonB family protein